jgi:heme/copper-type cytochrome/quinol oxidase subunit 3
MAFVLTGLAFSFIGWLKDPTEYIYLLLYFFSLLFCATALWIKDLLREKLYLKRHTIKVGNGLKLGFALFILSEACFFSAFFWTYFHNALNPSIELGAVWPPYGLQTMDIALPLVNSFLLLTSAATLTLGHLYIKSDRIKLIKYMFRLDKQTKTTAEVNKRFKTLRNIKSWISKRCLPLAVHAFFAHQKEEFEILKKVFKNEVNKDTETLIASGTPPWIIFVLKKYNQDWKNFNFESRFILASRDTMIKLSFIVTLTLAILFILTQVYEYKHAPFSISDGVYGSVFYILTGFHGLHVIVGTLFILVQYLRFINKQYIKNDSIGFETAAWYWHFVDIIWLFLVLLVYF